MDFVAIANTWIGIFLLIAVLLTGIVFLVAVTFVPSLFASAAFWALFMVE